MSAIPILKPAPAKKFRIVDELVKIDLEERLHNLSPALLHRLRGWRRASARRAELRAAAIAAALNALEPLP